MFPVSFLTAFWVCSLTEGQVRLLSALFMSLDEHDMGSHSDRKDSACHIHIPCGEKGGQQPIAGTGFKRITHAHRTSSLQSRGCSVQIL